jgi:hypothetical protein
MDSSIPIIPVTLVMFRFSAYHPLHHRYQLFPQMHGHFLKTLDHLSQVGLCCFILYIKLIGKRGSPLKLRIRILLLLPQQIRIIGQHRQYSCHPCPLQSQSL